MCYALADLLLAGDAALGAVATRVEAEMLPALGGTIRAAERRR
ncbi:MAG: hypothetical protein V1750_02185 [Acidobacteriota bacterium]